MKLHKLFVYGTLKQNFSNHIYLDQTQFIGQGQTKERFAMYTNGIPYVVKENPLYKIVGELYQINTNTLKRIDRLEGHPEWYFREEVEILTSEKTVVIAWMYFYFTITGNLNPTGIYTE